MRASRCGDVVRYRKWPEPVPVFLLREVCVSPGSLLAVFVQRERSFVISSGGSHPTDRQYSSYKALGQHKEYTGSESMANKIARHLVH